MAVPLDVDTPEGVALDVEVVDGQAKAVPAGSGARSSHLGWCPATDRWRDRADLARRMVGATQPAKPKKGTRRPSRGLDRLGGVDG